MSQIGKEHDVEASKEYRPFEDADTHVPKVMSFEQENGSGMFSHLCLVISKQLIL
jgi:hypothetical protein